jgi:hypothetical protein
LGYGLSQSREIFLIPGCVSLNPYLELGQLGQRIIQVKLGFGKTLNPNQVEPYALTHIGLSFRFSKYSINFKPILIQIKFESR